ncbi:sigma-70 family RNA polymerase sigma factor [Flavobacteriaceae bacterium AU392]|nr:sigma-70 family RNA polymerase sigma factor [Flavobacteriaceae bacterium]RKM84953.1 sigma-70 family RNA polymerase sigma factor [Flavobacteriaceae bacterium AU392]
MNHQKTNNDALDHIFRHEYGKIIAILIHRFGTTNIEKVEDAVQDALLKAMQVWAYKNIPDNPTAWLLRVSNNNIIDMMRRDKKSDLQNNLNQTIDQVNDEQEDVFLNNTINDNQLKMIFACCNPSLSINYQIILSLKLIGGFSNKEISRALLKKEDTVAKSFTRAKQQFKKHVKTIETPIELGLSSRIHIVLKVIYLLFSEGYKASSGESIIKKDICFEAIRLGLLLLENKIQQSQETYALIALMCFHTSRFEARINAFNELVDLEHQDRLKYDKELIALGIKHLNLATNKNIFPSSYYLQAAISYYHCTAKTFNKTDWKSILYLYDLQLKHQYSPIIGLNRIIPYYKLYGAQKGLIALNKYKAEANALKNTLFYSIKGELYKDLEENKLSKMALEKAIDLSENEMEIKHLKKKIKALK